MPRQSDTGNVRKICGCVKWKDCAHPWYVDYREGKDVDRGSGSFGLTQGCGSVLSLLVGREPVDYADAKAEARRAIVAWKDGRNAAGSCCRVTVPRSRPPSLRVRLRTAGRCGGQKG